MPKTNAGEAPVAANNAPQIEWDDSHMKSAYANVCNVASTQEEVIFFFGTNQAWKGDESAVKVMLSDRVIMSPHAAKRLYLLLGNVIGQYEKRFGQLGATTAGATGSAAGS